MNKKEMNELVQALSNFKHQHDLELEFGETQEIESVIDIIDSFLEGL